MTSESIGICWQQKAWLVRGEWKQKVCRQADLPCMCSLTEVLNWYSLPAQRRGSQVRLKLSPDLGCLETGSVPGQVSRSGAVGVRFILA